MSRTSEAARGSAGGGGEPARLTPRALLFDFDNTLHDQGAAYRQTLAAAVGPHCAPGITVEDVAARCHASWAELWAAYVAGRLDEDGLYAAWFESMRAATGGRARTADLRRAYEAAEDATLQLYPDVLPALAAARALRPDIRLAVVTNGAARKQRARLEGVGLVRQIPVLVISGAVGIAKPEPGIFARALADLGVAAGQAVMVGDSPEADVAGAKRAGLGAVWLNRAGMAWPEGVAPGPDAVAADLQAAVRAALGSGA